MLVNVRIAKFLINARVSYKSDKVRHQLRKQFPCSQMAQHEHHGNTYAKFAGHRLNIFNRNAFEDLLRRHCREFYAAEQVSPKELKVPAYETTQFARRFEHGRFLIIGGNAEKLKSQFAAAEREAEAWTYDDLASKVSRGGDKAAFETAIWLYPSAQHDDGTVADALSRCAEAIILLPRPGADPATRRPQLV